MHNTAILPLLLKELRLPSMLYHLDEMERRALEDSWPPSRFLVNLCEVEINERKARRIQRFTKEAKLPPGKSLATFDFKHPAKLNKAHMEALAQNIQWVEQAENLIIFGPSGVGKTHLASAIGHALIEQGVRVYFTQTSTLVQQMQLAKKEYRLPQMLAKFDKYALLILDDIGYAKKDESETSVLFDLIADRYESGSLAITANQPFSQWDSIFPDNMMAVAAIDRLVHHATIINIEAESYRKAQANSTKING